MKWNSHETSLDRGKEVKPSCLSCCLCVFFGSSVGEMETEVSRVMLSPGDEEERFV